MTIQVALIGMSTSDVCHLLSAFVIRCFIKKYDVPLLCGFNFIVGTLIAMLVKKLLALCKRERLSRNNLLTTSCSSASPARRWI
jgi:hypothetical protein